VIAPGLGFDEAQAQAIARSAIVSFVSSRPARASLPARIIIAILSAVLLVAMLSVSAPKDVLGATVSKTTLCPANVRTSASLTASIKALIAKGTRVSVAATVSGGHWRTSCPGTSVSGTSWYRISAINGTSVKTLYGVSYVYAATRLFKATPYTRYAACTAYLRTKASTSATSKRAIATNTKVLVATKVYGTSWSRTCAGRPVSGKTWYRISMINGRTVRSLYGISYLYSQTGLFTSAPTAYTASSVPPPPPPAGPSVRVTSVAGLMSALANNSLSEIVVANGTYHVSPANSQRSDSLYIGARYAGRTRPITVRAETRGGVTFNGGGGSSYGGLTFVNGAHDQTWDGFNFANMVPVDTGIIVFGGITTLRPPHHITLRSITLKSTCRRPGASNINAQGVYFAHALTSGPHDLLLEDLKVDGTDPLSLWSAIHAYHGDATHPPSYNVTIRRLTVTGTTYPVVLWNDSAVQHDWLIEGARITGAKLNAIRFESVGARNIVLKDIVTTGSGQTGFYSTMGAHPPGVTFINDSFH
jgi:hypothetical protein